MSSGVNFAVPIDVVRLVVPRLIVFGTSLPQTSLTE
jgi:S1-C subfamily serine protease